MIRRILAAALLVGALVLSACSGLPTSGPVNAGAPADGTPTTPDFAFRPNSPQPGATPEQIVAGFLDAQTSPENSWRIAREFLTTGFEAQWQPTAGVTVDQPGSRRTVATEAEEEAEITLTVTVIADVDETGAYNVSEPAESILPYTLEQENGEWRISSAPEGVVLERDFFADVYRPYSLMYYDPTWTSLVPDVRWFAYRSQAVTTWIASALIGGSPSPWLAGSVQSAFPDEVALAGPSVTVDSRGAAQVELTDAALQATPETQSRMQRQLEATLRSAGIADADMLVNGTVLDVLPAPVQSTAIEPWPLVMVDGVVGYLTGDGLASLGSAMSAEVAAATPDALALGRAGEVAAVRAADGVVSRVTAEGRAVVDERAGIVSPTIDAEGFVWTVPALTPAALQAVGADGVIHAVAGAWPLATRVHAVRVSREGTRIAAIVSEAGRDWIVAAGIIRDAAGVPVSLGDQIHVARLDASGYALDWLDDHTLGVLVRTEDTTRVLTQTVGGLGSATTAPLGEIVMIAAGSGVAVPRVLDAEGTLFTRRGSTWTQAATEIQVLGTQVGG